MQRVNHQSLMFSSLQLMALEVEPVDVRAYQE